MSGGRIQVQGAGRNKDAAMSTVQVSQGDTWMEALDLALNDADIPTF